MESNKDEALRCVKIARKFFIEGKLDQAEKFLLKAEKLYPTSEAKKLLSKLEKFPSRNGSTEPNGTEGLHKREHIVLPHRHEPEYTPEQLEAVKRIENCKNCYEVLNVTKKATDSEIKKAYKKLALQLHPDKNKAPGSVEAFKELKNAMAVLTDAEKREEREQFDFFFSW